MVERPISAAPVYQDGKEAGPNHGKPHDWTDANTDQKGGQMAGNQELSGFRLWWRKNRKWVFGVLAAAIMGVLLFYPGMAYIYERIGWRSPLLPRPGTEWLHEASYPGYLDIHLKVRWDTEDISSYYRDASSSSNYPTTVQGIIAMQKIEDVDFERSFENTMSRSVALVVLEVIDYVDLTKEDENGSDKVVTSLAHCQVEKVLAQRKDMCRLQEGDNIVVWTRYASNYGNTGSAKEKPVLIRCGQKSIQLLEMSEKMVDLIGSAKIIAPIAPYYAPYNIGVNYIPIEEGRKPNLTSVSRFLYLPDAIKRYGPTKYWTLDILSKELQDYYDHSSYYYGRS